MGSLKNACYLYRHIRVDTNDVFYIGIGKTVSDKTKEILRQCNLGKSNITDIGRVNLSNFQKLIGCKKVLKLDLNDNFIEEYTSIADAAYKNGLSSSSSIVKFLKGITKSSGGFKWKYKDE